MIANRDEFIITTTESQQDLKLLQDGSFQVSVMSGGRLRLTALTVTKVKEKGRCPVVLGGERCGDKVGHEGKHVWGRGD